MNQITAGSLEDSDDLQSSVKQLKMANSQLFRLAVKHIIGEDRDV